MILYNQGENMASASRMDRYNEKSELSRSNRNTNLYDTLYDDSNYSIKTLEKTISKTNELDLEAIKNMIATEKKYERKVVENKEELPPDSEEEKNYDINEIMMQARNNYKEDNLKRSLKETPFEIKEKIEKVRKHNEEIENESEVETDLFSDLKATRTIEEGTIKDIIQKEKEEFEDQTRQTTMTTTLGFDAKDFEELQDMHNSIKENNILLKIFLIILIVCALLVTAYAIYKII